ncbi:hypothetical protein HXX76_013647 [Chlamydomonas incerta]|uniref:N-acetyltransferase domain-containing protein n=1 Tax=Chlamydomonas incerta TaxID=51695 RepID=A0A835ST66_CHLIN|nr:hypothetical protein HXX76_013647 [Chlamydomonas incerta]|eukprot:KAG2425436.1 hypothetical protein HXX76_013647 [Chlamydomonas incerta]
MSAVRQKCAVAETGPPVAAQVLFEVLRPFGPDVDAASQAAFHAVSQLLQDEFPHNTADVKNSVYRGRCPYTGSRPGDDVRFDPYLVACLWLGGQVVAAAALRLNLPPLSAVSSSSSGGGGGGGGGAEAAHLQVVLQATSARLQRRGLGRLLTRCVMRAAAEEGHQYLTALVSDQTKAPFWERVGFCAPPSSYLRLPLALYRSLEESRAHSLFSDVSVWHVELPGWESQGAVRGEAAAEAAGAEAGMETAAVAMETEGPGGVAVGAEPGTPSPAGRRRCAAAHAMVEEAAARVAAAALGSAASSPAAAAAATHAPLAAGASGGGGGWPGSPQQARLLPHPQQDSGAAAPQHMAPPQLVLPPPSQEPPQLLTPEQRLVYPESRRPSAGAGQSSAAGAAHSSLLGLSGGWPTPQNLSPDGTAGFEEKAAGPMPSQQQVKEWQRWGLLQRREQRNLAQQALEDGSDCGLANCITEAWQSQQAAGAGAGAAGQHTRTMLPASPARAQSSAAAAAVVAAATAAAAGAHGAQQQESLAPYTQVQQGSLGGAGQQGQELESAAAAAAGGMTWTTGLALQQQQQQQQLDAGRAARVQQAQACGASTAAAASSWLAAVAPGGPPAINFTFPAQLIQQPWLLEWPATGPAGAAAGAAAFAGGLGRNRCGDSSGTGGDGGGGSASLRAPQLEAAEAAVPAGLAGHMPAAPGAQQQLQSPQPQPLQQQAAPSSEAAAGQQLQQGSVSFQLFSRCCRTGACTLSRAAAHAAFPKQAAAATQAHLARQLSYLGGPSAPAAAGAGAATAAIATAAAGACAGIVGSSSAVSQPVGIWYRRPAASPAAGVGDDAAALLPHHGARLSGDGQQRYRLCGMGPLRTALGVDNSTPLRLTVLTECGRSVIAPDAAAAGVAVLVLSHAFAAFVHGHFGVRGSLMTALLGPEVATRGGVPDLVLYDKTTRAPIPGGPGGARLRTLCSGDNRLPGRTPVWDVAGLGPWLRRHQAAEGDQLVFTAEPSAAATLEDPSPSAAATEGGGRSDDVTTTTRVYVKYVRVPRPSAGQGAAGGGGRGAGAAAGPAGGCSSAGHPIAMDAMQEGCPAADTIESDGWEADGQDAQSEQPDDETAGVTATMANGALVRAPGLMGEHLQQWAAGDGAAAGVGEGESRRALTAAPAAGGATASEDATTRCYGPPAELQHGDGTCLVVCRARFSQLSFEAVAALLGPATATSGMMPGGAAAGGDGGPTELPVRVPPHQQHWAPAAALRCLPAPSGHQKARRWRVVGLGVWLEKVGAVPGSSMLHFRAVRGATGTTAYGPAGNAAGATTADAAAGPGASGRCGHVVAVEVSVVAVQGGGPSRLPCGTGGGSIGVPGSGSAATAATTKGGVVREAAAAAAAGAGSGTTSGRLVAVEVSVVGKAASAKRAHLSADEGETTDEVVVSTESTESTEGSSETDELDSDQDEQQPLQARNAQPGDPCQYSGPTPHGTGTRRGRLAVGDDPCVVTYKHHWMPSWTMAALLGPAAAKAPAAGVAVPAVLPLRVPLPERHLAPAAVLKRGNGKDAASWCFTGLCAWLRHVHVSRGGVLRFGAVWEAPAAGREQGGSAGAGGSGSATAGGGRRVVAVEVSVVEAVVGTQQDGGAAAGSGLEPAGTRSWAESVKDHSAGGGHAAPLGRTAAVAVLAVAPASGHRRPGPQTAAPAGTGAGGAAAGHTLLPLLRQPQQQQHSLGAVSPVAETAAALVGAVDSTAAGMECRRAGTDNGAPGPAADGGEAAPTRAAASSLSSGRGGGWRPVYLIPSDLKSAGGSPQNFAGGSKHLAGHEETPAAGHSPNAAAVAGPPAAPPAHQGPCGSDSDAAAAAGGSAGATPAAAGPAPRPPSGGAAVPAATAGLREALSQHFPRALSLLLTEVDAAAQQEQGEQRRGLGVAAAAALPVLPMEVLKRYAVGVGWEYEVEIERRRVDCAAEAGPGHDGSTRYLATVCMLQPGDGDATITASGKDAADKDTARQLAAAACLQRLLTLGVSPQVLWPGCRSSQPPAAQTPRPQPQPQQENYGLAQAAHVAAPQPSPAPAPQPPQQAAQPAGQQQQQQQQQQAQVPQPVHPHSQLYGTHPPHAQYDPRFAQQPPYYPPAPFWQYPPPYQPHPGVLQYPPPYGVPFQPHCSAPYQGGSLLARGKLVMYNSSHTNARSSRRSSSRNRSSSSNNCSNRQAGIRQAVAAARAWQQQAHRRLLPFAV